MKDIDISKFNIPMPDLGTLSDAFAQENEKIQNTFAAMNEFNQKKRENEQRQLDALEATAANTAEANNRLNTVIDNQNKYIQSLEGQIALQKEQLDLLKNQLQILSNIFASNEDGVAVEKEIMKLIINEIDDKHPLWAYVADKGGDLAVIGTTAVTPVLYKAFKAYLLTRGIILP